MDEAEVRGMLQRLDSSAPVEDKPGWVYGSRECNLHGQRVTQSFTIPVTGAKCMVALVWLLGRRIGEILQMNKEDVVMPFIFEEIVDGILVRTEGARFLCYVEKRKVAVPQKPKFVALTEATRPYLEMVQAHMRAVPDRECVPCGKSFEGAMEKCPRCGKATTSGRLFRGKSYAPKRVRYVRSRMFWSALKAMAGADPLLNAAVSAYERTRDPEQAFAVLDAYQGPLKEAVSALRVQSGGVKRMEYDNPLVGRWSLSYAWSIWKHLDADCSPHFGRHSFLTKLSNATHGNAFMMKEAVDWTNTNPAVHYVEGTKMAKGVSDAMWGDKPRRAPETDTASL